MGEYDEFFKYNDVKLVFGRNRIRVNSLDMARSSFNDFITLNSITALKKMDGRLVVGTTLIALFSIDGRLWNTDEEEVTW